jgi:diguanylate cyclase (GGDEF)-like protein
MHKYSNKALWGTYLFIVCFSLLAAGTFLNLKWQDIKADAAVQQTNINKLIANSMSNYLDRYEMFLNVLGSRLFELSANNENYEAKKLIETMMLEHAELSGLALANTEGELILRSDSLKHKALINLREKPETKASFEETLKSTQLIMGRTYFMPNVQEWVVPLRISIRNYAGHIIGVMTVGLKLSHLEKEWLGNSLPSDLRLLVLRKDLYRQYASFVGPDSYEEMLGKPLEEDRFKQTLAIIYQQTGKTIEDIETEGEFLSYIAPDRDGTDNIQTASYNTKHQYYIVTATTYTVLYERLLTPTSWLILFLCIFNFGLYLLFRSNIHTHWQAKASLQHQIEHDSLTKLPNRRYLVNHFHEWSSSHSAEHSLLYLDLNNFKTCNDIYGHTTGDRILCTVADRLVEFFSDSLCARQGGDEFIILSPVTNQSVLLKKCEEFAKSLAKTIHVESLEFSIYASIGISFSPTDGETLDELLRKADMAMYEAKRKQSNIGFYSEELEAKTKQASAIENELTSALKNNEFTVYYQPQVDAYSYQVLGIEALLRWNNPRLGFVPPDVFIPVAEASGLINDIGRFVMEQALKDGYEVSSVCALKHKLRVSVNLSVSQLFNGDFIEHLKGLLAQYKGQEVTFMLEVTESLFIDDLIRAKDILEQAKSCGVYISLDDFGTGYSSLSVLSKLPINELKIDRSFVNDILTDEHDWLLAKSIIYLCKSLSIPVVAEGVENKAQADRLAAHGCDVFQGYYFAKPMPKADLINFLNDKKALQQA